MASKAHICSRGPDFLLIPRSALTSLELCTNHRLRRSLKESAPCGWYITDSRASRSRSSRICSRRRVDSTCASTATSDDEQEVQVSQTVISNTRANLVFICMFSFQDSRQSKSCFVTTSLRPHPWSDGPRVRPGYIYIITDPRRVVYVVTCLPLP